MLPHRTRLYHASLGCVLSLTMASAVDASSHREAPLITEFPKVDATDFYAFNSYEPGREHYVTLIANYLPLQDAYGGPNYFSLDSAALYEIHIDNDGDAIEDVSFQFRFSEALGGDGGAKLTIGDENVAVPLKALGPISASSLANANVSERYNLAMVSGDRRRGSARSATDSVDGSTHFAKPLDYFGEKTFGDAYDYDAYLVSLTNSGSVYHDIVLEDCPAGAREARVFVGQRKDSFSISLGRVFDLVNLDPLTDRQDAANDDLADKNITTLALEVHRDCLTGGGDNSVIGAWTSASKQQVTVFRPKPSFQRPTLAGGAWTQLSRLGNPLVNEVVIGLPDKNRFNASEPKDDGQFATYVTHPTLPAILNLLFNSNGEFVPNGSIAPAVPRNDLVAAFLTGVAGVNQLPMVTPAEMLRLNTAIAATPMHDQSSLGVAGGDLAGFPNGRRPGDDVTDIALRAVMGAFCQALPIDLNGDDRINEADNLLLCGDTPQESAAAAPVGGAPFSDGTPQNAGQFDATFPYLTMPIPGATVY